jgi:acetylornithine deacetylase/succinyl-diaminopimelate desuccinylase-like protein
VNDPLVPRVLDLACEIQQIPAPTFQEAARAAFVRDRLAAEQLADVEMDELGNVFARLPGRDPQAAPLLVTAHLDTVFPADTPLALDRRAERIAGPGIGDNSLGVAGLFGVIWSARDAPLPADVWLAANVGEEGLGDLRGMRRVVDRLGQRVRAVVVLEGMALGHIYHAGLGVRRYRLSVQTEGGHSWLHFGRPSAIHELVKLGAEITALPLEATPRTTFNIGTITGGTSVNTIAREASFDLDLRSESPSALQALAASVEALAAEHAGPQVAVSAEVIGNRPTGALSPEHPLVVLAVRALAAAGVNDCSLEIGSTDANIPLSRGLPCVCLGLTRGANSHRPDEYIETRDLDRGLGAMLRVVRGAFEIA